MPARPDPLSRPTSLVALALAAVVLAIGTPGEVSGPTGDDATRGPDAELATRLVGRLAAADRRERDAAAARLRGLGVAALDALRAGSASDDASIRLRCRALLEALDGGETAGAAWRRDESRALVRVLLPDATRLRPGSPDDARLAALHPESGDALATAIRATAEERLVRPAWAAALARHVTDDGLSLLVALLVDERLPPSGALAAARALVAPSSGGTAPVGRTSTTARRAAAERLAPALESRAAPRRRAATALLAALTDERSAERLVELARDTDRGVRLEAVRGLAPRRAPGVLTTLLDRADDPAPEVRAAALAALPPRAAFGSLEVVLRAADSEHAPVRAASAHLLAASGTPETRAVLARLAVDDSARVRAATRRALAVR